MAVARVTVEARVEFLGTVAAYIRHEIDLRQLNEWMARHTSWMMNADSDRDSQVAGIIDLNLAEIEAGHASEEDLRQELHQFFKTNPDLVVAMPWQTESDAERTTLPPPNSTVGTWSGATWSWVSVHIVDRDSGPQGQPAETLVFNFNEER
ncbi:MAG TPA: hypothetical protein VNL16_07920 [Chloroflexota bacterium]|nr:hypothetical protein [Chloroflexota bacterium]